MTKLLTIIAATLLSGCGDQRAPTSPLAQTAKFRTFVVTPAQSACLDREDRRRPHLHAYIGGGPDDPFVRCGIVVGRRGPECAPPHQCDDHGFLIASPAAKRLVAASCPDANPLYVEMHGACPPGLKEKKS